MSMYAQQYENPSRIVSGTPVLTNNDVVLYCDTSSGPVTINLLDIPNDYWMTTWKLYVVDNSNNASTNNITINAGTGQTINAQSSVILNVNGGSCIVRISGNTTFVCEPLAINLSDTGWVDLEGFSFLGSSFTRKPQFRVYGKQIFFRGTAIVPLSSASNGSTLVPMTDSGVGGFYVNDSYAYVYQGTGGCLLNSSGSLFFNLGNNIFPSDYAGLQLDNSYNTGFIIGSRVVKTRDANSGVALTGVYNVIIDSSQRLSIQTFKDLESSPNIPNPVNGIGSGGARQLISKVKAGQYVTSWQLQTNGYTQSSISNTSNLRTWVVPSATNQFLFDVDPAEETEIGGFQVNLDGLSAWVI
jgi:hypothetical protein